MYLELATVCVVGRTIYRLLHLPFSSRFLLNGTGTRFRLNGTGQDGNVTVFMPPTVVNECVDSKSGLMSDKALPRALALIGLLYDTLMWTATTAYW